MAIRTRVVGFWPWDKRVEQCEPINIDFLKKLDPNAALVVTFKDGTVCPVPEKTNSDIVLNNKQITSPKALDVYWQGLHGKTKNLLTLVQCTDVHMYMRLYDSGRSVALISLWRFVAPEEVPPNQPSPWANDHKGVLAAVAFMTPLAEMYQKDDLDADGVKAKVREGWKSLPYHKRPAQAIASEVEATPPAVKAAPVKKAKAEKAQEGKAKVVPILKKPIEVKAKVKLEPTSPKRPRVTFADKAPSPAKAASTSTSSAPAKTSSTSTSSAPPKLEKKNAFEDLIPI